MNNRINIQEELKSISPTVAQIPVANVFSVPNGYFDTLCIHILASIPFREEPVSILSKKPFSVPENYFDGLADSILSKIKNATESDAAEELMQLSPVIAQIEKKNVFSVPDNYFENNINKIVSATQPHQAKVVTMQKRPLFARYAVAAAITGLIGLSVISVFNNNSSKNLFANSEIKTAMKDANTIIKNDNFDEELNNLSDKDIEQYLTKKGLDVNAALVASSTDDNNNLPSPEDYINNDNTLDNYLNNANLNN
ncbi:MAG: hypothetical protein JSU03_10395 [Bacteroidetes bacterium]|nr:hypothetical protein [Bacteroidota bacterium]MBS1757678.1 hypothetical protein [Bacteroidota bacterium]